MFNIRVLLVQNVERCNVCPWDRQVIQNPEKSQHFHLKLAPPASKRGSRSGSLKAGEDPEALLCSRSGGDPSPKLAQPLSKAVQATPNRPPNSMDSSVTTRGRRSEGLHPGSGPETLPLTNPGGGQQLPSARIHQTGDHPSFPMAEHLVFSAQHPPEKMVEGPGGGANPEFHCKRARSDCDDLSAMPQRERVKDRTVGKSSAKVHCSSRPPVEEMSGTSKATETGIKQRPIVSKPIPSKPVGGKGSRFDVLSEQMVEESDAIMEGKVLKGKDLLTTSGEPDTPLAAGKSVLRDIPNRGKTPRRDQMALKAGTSKIKKVPFPKKGLLNFRSPPILLQKEVVLNPNPVDDMEDVCEDSEVLQSLHKDVLNSDMADNEKMRATSGDPQNLIVFEKIKNKMDRSPITMGPGMDMPIMHDSDRYDFVRDIGSGNFGVARLMRDKVTKELVAVKYIERGDKIDENVQREIINHRSLRHPNIVRFKEVILTPTHLAIVMEYASGGELFERIGKCNAGRFSEDEARFFFQQLISGVSYCHAMQVCHRDLKLENTLLDGSPAPRLKICDFGYSKVVLTFFSDLSGSSVLHSQPKSTVGTPAYIAPEVLLRQEYDGKLFGCLTKLQKCQGPFEEGTSEQQISIFVSDYVPGYSSFHVSALVLDNFHEKIADVWSCGVTLYVMLVGAYPFEDPDEPKDFRKTIQRILSVQYSIPDAVQISRECRDLISRIFVVDPATRITIPDIRNHPWFLKNLPADLMDEKKMGSQYEEPDQPMQSIDVIMQIIAEASIPAVGTHGISCLLSDNFDMDDDMEDLDSESELDIDSSGEIVYAM
ncbi:hypothetical protein JRO89_XS08G0178800 [Xanthoceras sorbifolium]|uniref:non-specific serine/threonine protein kinase n=1 Tax=Xanthoceras sorbifolium TaxID=99658 RepID=A0ABQ8HQC2_9ROSI|nr:hypothetical protein JRO89_XS08G0178800 [Xanthoceras sorbifolium]